MKDSPWVVGAGLVATTLVAGRANAWGQSRTPSSRPIIYHGYVAFQDDNRISIFTLDAVTGKLAWKEDVAVAGGPAPMVIEPGRNILYVGHRGSNDLSSYRIDQRTGRLSLIGTTPLQGEPVQMSVDRKGRFVLSAYWHQSTIGVHAIDGNGVVVFPPIEWRHTAHGAHSIYTDRSNRFAFVPHTAGGGRPNAIFQFKFDEQTGRLTPNDPPRLSLQEVLGPRHLCFHPTRDILYSVNEQGSSVTAYTLDPSSGTLTLFQTIRTVPEGEKSGPADIHISPSGKFLYASNRGHNSIASFTVDSSTGRLVATGWVPTEPGPRTFSLDPEGSFLVVAGLDSGLLASYQVHQDTGKLTHVETYKGGKKPMWVLMTKLRG